MNINSYNRTKIARIVTFLVLTFGLSTIFYALIIKDGGYRGPWLTPLMLCPSISAILTKLVFDRNLKGLGWKPGPAKWLGLAYLLPILYGAVIYGTVWLLGQGGINADAIAMVTSTQFGMSNASGVQMAVMVIAYALLFGTIQLLRYSLLSAFGEELGWRGFLFPELHRMTSFTTASLISGIVWVLFHLPLILFADYNSTAPRAFVVVVFSISAIARTFLHNWFRARSGSVWPNAVLHASNNVFLNNVLDPLMTRYPLTDFFVTEFGAGLLVIHVLMALYIWAHRKELDAKPAANMEIAAQLLTAAD